MKAHIQMPKMLMKNFATKHKNKGDTVFSLDLSSMVITEVSIKTLGTAEDFYSEEVETFLGKEVETEFGRVSKKFKEFSKEKLDTLDVTYEDDLIVKRFVLFSSLRGELILKKFNSNNILH